MTDKKEVATATEEVLPGIELEDFLKANPTELGEGVFNGAFVAIKKDCFDVGNRLLYEGIYTSSIINGKGTAELEHVTPGTVLPQLRQTLVSKPDLPVLEQMDRFVDRVVILKGGDCIDITEQHLSRPAGISDEKIKSIYKSIGDYTIPSDLKWEPGAQVIEMAQRYEQNPGEDEMDKQLRDYFPMLKDEMDDYMFYLVADPITMASVGAKGYMKDVNMFNLDIKIRGEGEKKGDDDEVYLGAETFEINVDNKALETNSIKCGVGYMRPIYHGSNKFYVKMTKEEMDEYGPNPVFSTTSEHDKYEIFKKFNNQFHSFTYSKSPENRLIVPRYVSDLATKVVFNMYPISTTLKPKRLTFINGDDFTKKNVAIRLYTIINMCIKRKKEIQDKLEIDERHLMAFAHQGLVESQMISPNQLNSFRKAGGGIKDEFLAEKTKNQFISVDANCKVSAYENFRKNGGEDVNKIDMESQQIMASRLDSESRLATIFDDRSLFSATKIQTKTDFANELGEGELFKTEPLRWRYGMRAAKNELFTEVIKNPIHKVLCGFNGDLEMFKSVVVRDCMVLLKNSILNSGEDVMLHPGMNETDNPNHCEFCDYVFNNGKIGVEKDFCLCYMIMSTLCKLEKKKSTKPNFDKMWKDIICRQTKAPTSVATAYDTGFNCSFRTVENNNKCGTYGDNVLENPAKNDGFYKRKDDKDVKTLQNYEKSKRVSTIVNEVINKAPSFLTSGQSFNMNNNGENEPHFLEVYSEQHKNTVGFLYEVIKDPRTFNERDVDIEIGSHRFNAAKALAEAILTDPTSEETYDIATFYQSKDKLRVVGTLKSKHVVEDEDEDEDGLDSINEHSKRSKSSKGGIKKKSKVSKTNPGINACARALCYQMTLPGTDKLGDEPINTNYAIILKNKTTAAEVATQLMLMLSPNSAANINIRGIALENYVKGLANYAKKVSDVLVDNLNFEDYAELRTAINESCKMTKNNCKKTLNAWIDPHSCKDPIQKTVERKMLHVLNTHYAETLMFSKNPVIYSDDNTKGEYLNSKCKPRYGSMGMDRKFIFPTIVPGSIPGVNRFMFNKTEIENNMGSIDKLLSSGRYSFITPMKSNMKMDTFNREDNDIEKERYDDTGANKTATEKLTNTIKTVCDSIRSGKRYSSFSLCQKNGTDVLSTGVLAAAFRKMNVDFSNVNSNMFATANITDGVKTAEYVIEYLEKYALNNMIRPTLMSIIRTDMSDICIMNDKVKKRVGALFRHIQPLNAATHQKVFGESSVLNVSLKRVMVKDNNLGSVLHLYSLISEIYGFNASTSLNYYSADYERDTQAATVLVGSILGLFLGTNKSDVVNKGRSITERHRKSKPVSTTLIAHSFKNDQFMKISTLNDIKCNGMSKLMGRVSIVNYENPQDKTTKYTKFSLGGGFFRDSLPANMCGQARDKMSTQPVMCIKSPYIYYNIFKNKGRRVNMVELIETGDLEKISQTIRTTSGLAKKLAAYLCESLSITFTEGEMPDMDGKSKEEFLHCIVHTLFPNHTDEVRFESVVENVISYALPYIYPTEEEVEDEEGMDIDFDLNNEDGDYDSDNDDNDEPDDMDGLDFGC